MNASETAEKIRLYDEAIHEASCCDDIPLNQPLAGIISDLQTDREHLRSLSVEMLEALKAQEEADEANEVRLGYAEWRVLEDKAKALRVAAIAKAEGRSS